MQFSGTNEIGAPRARVWDFVNDPEQVGWCGPGVESIEVADATHFRARARVGIGAVAARFALDLELLEQEAPERAVIRATGQAPGSAVDATGEMRLEGPPEGPTTMRWIATVTISGTIARVGARLIESTATTMIKQTFDCMRARLEA
ncbi:MAG TPA: carbon monoxide dehydrogenase subunit G [Candidatus Deferrimicrobiaceae bacterium]|nr:carbon monoxide dehydrogenase subunit G [Candidatus Deferrimicrobiaceae bacterium]